MNKRIHTFQYFVTKEVSMDLDVNMNQYQKKFSQMKIGTLFTYNNPFMGNYLFILVDEKMETRYGPPFYEPKIWTIFEINEKNRQDIPIHLIHMDTIEILHEPP